MDVGIVGFLAGVILGGLISWAVTHQYFKRAMDGQTRVSSADTLIDKPLDTVWNAISNLENREKFYFRGAKHFDDAVVGKGTPYRVVGLYGESKEYIAVWEPPHRLAWGPDPYEWAFYFELKASGSATRLFLRRRSPVHTPPWTVVLAERLLPGVPAGDTTSVHLLNEEMLEKIRILCENA